MTIINNCELWFAKLGKPNNKFNKENPTWELQIRTSDKAVKSAWEGLNLAVKGIVPDEGPPFWRVNLRKKSIKADGSPAAPIKVVNGKLEEIDPNSIGHGSIGNVRIFQYEYQDAKKQTKIASILMGVQVTKLQKFVKKARDDDFTEGENEVVEPEDNDDAF